MTNTLDESHWGGPYHSDSHTIITVWVRWHVFKFPFKHLLLCLWLLLLSPLSLFFLENYPKRQQMVTKKLSWDAFLRTWVCAFWVQHWEVWVCKGNKKKKNTCTDLSKETVCTGTEPNRHANIKSDVKCRRLKNCNQGPMARKGTPQLLISTLVQYIDAIHEYLGRPAQISIRIFNMANQTGWEKTNTISLEIPVSTGR